jgi:hypothetical protein
LLNVGVLRVRVKIPGHPVVVRVSLVDAVNVLNDIIRKRKSDESMYTYGDAAGLQVLKALSWQPLFPFKSSARGLSPSPLSLLRM